MTGPSGMLTHGIPLLGHWLLESFFAATALLGLGTPVLLRLRSAPLRQRLAEGILLAVLLVAILAAIPGIRPWSLGILAAKTHPAVPGDSTTRLHIGLIRHFSGSAMQSASAIMAPGAPPASPLLVQCRRCAAGLLATIKSLLPPIGLVELLYAAGVSLCLLRLLLAAILLRRLVWRSIAAEPDVLAIWQSAARRLLSAESGGHYTRRGVAAELRIAPDIASPIAFGIWRRYVLIPPQLARHCPHETLAAIFRHEAAHLIRRDGWSQFVAAIAGAVYFYHPLVHLLRRRIGRDRELIADNCAAGLCGGPLAYARHLLHAAHMCPSQRPAALAVGLVTRQSELRTRIVQLTQPTSGSMQMFSRKYLALCGLCLLAAAICISMVTLRAKAADAAGIKAVGTSGARTKTGARSLAHCRQTGIAFLLKRQDADGAWLGRYGPAVTALAMKALIQDGYSIHSVPVAHGLAFIETQRHADGGFYGNTEPLYNTAIVMRTLGYFHTVRIGRQIAAAKAFLRRANRLPNQRIQEWFGSRRQTTAGGQTRIPGTFWNARADQSGQTGLLEAALRMAEQPEKVSATTATAPDEAPAAPFAMSPLNAPSLDPHERRAGMRLTNYGNITYSQLKSMVYAGLSAHEVRTRRLLAWLTRHYTLAVNPAEGTTRGLFYYYLTAAEVLRASGQRTIVDDRGIRHHWRSELAHRLADMQRADGGWQNRTSGSWLEGNRIMATTYAVLTLEELRH